MTDESTPTTQQAVDVLKHDAERDVRHGLSHLEDEFLKKLGELGSFSRAEGKALLAWVAGKL